jgi:cysteine desulfuration protein SufE
MGGMTDQPAPMPVLADLQEEYEFLDADDRYRLLIDLGRGLEDMPDALKTDMTLVRGCSAAVWVYPTVLDHGQLHFLADSNAAITKGIIALVLLTVQDRAPAEIGATDIEGALRPQEPAQLQPHPGHSQHDRPDPRDRCPLRLTETPAHPRVLA